MPKYRKLTTDELQAMEKEFVLFLSSQGISADLWLRYKQGDPTKVNNLIDDFSDMILGRIYEKCDLFEKISRDAWLFYLIEPEQIRLIGLTIDDESIDLRTMSKEQIMAWYDTAPAGAAKTVSATKTMTKPREEEVEVLVKMGSRVSENRSLYDLLSKVHSES